MVLSIKSDEADRLARELSRETGESITDAVTAALRERLDRVRVRPDTVTERLLAVAAAASSLPRLDHRSDDEILGYDADGLPT